MSLDKFKIEQTAKNVLGHFDPNVKLEITLSDNVCNLNIETEFSGLLIGKRGETLEALQHVLRLILARELDSFTPVMIDIAGYRAEKEKEIQDLARAMAEKVINFGGTESLPPMNAYERRLAHLVLKEFDNIESVSEGEEPSRKIIIKPKRG
ncbi:MAG: R3H domain-containing nucleic acid-binding protein [Patescibacteria group bacterium]|jgi:spoIIIJ-associated protein